MSPRAYSMEKRQAVSNENRQRILEAARQVLARGSETSLTMEAIAVRAGVSRLTLYYQFDSRTGLLEALYNHLAMRGGMERMPEVFREADPFLALERIVRIFVGFWSSDRVVIRRLRSMAALDSEIGDGIRSRDARRHRIAAKILGRIVAAANKPYAAGELSATADVIGMLTGFATYDALASAGHGEEEIVATICRLVRFAAGG